MAILEMRRAFLEGFGYETITTLEMDMTGHLHYGSAMETADTCGNCDGGNCDTCHELYTVKSEMKIPGEFISQPWDCLIPLRVRHFTDKKKAMDDYNTKMRWVF